MTEVETAHLELAPVMGGASAADLFAALGKLRGKPLRIDASHVVRPATLDIQLLFSAAATWAADGYRLEVAEASGALRQSAAILGLDASMLCMEPIGEPAAE